MIAVHNASQWYQKQLEDGSTLYSANLITAADPAEFSVANQPTCWKSRYGAFAQVWVNHRTREVLMVRDHFGCEPLFYYLDESRLIFSSNLPDLLKQLPQKPVVDETQITELMRHYQRYSDQTLYQGIKRVEPGSYVLINDQGLIKQHLYWYLDPEANDIILPNDDAYIARFTELMNEAIHFCTKGQEHLIAGELSGGLDSSSILTTAHHQGLHYPLFMHCAPPNSQELDDSQLAKQLLAAFKINDAHFIGAEGFDPIKEYQDCAKIFAGPPAYLFPVYAQNINRAVIQSGRKILLSGAGGDECVSSHANIMGLIPNVIRTKGYRAAWKILTEIYQQNPRPFQTIRQLEKLIKHMHPWSFSCVEKMEKHYRNIRHLAKPSLHPFQQYYPSVRAYEADKLQGLDSQAIRGRIESCAILAKHLGFEYRYPLLYPKLVEFCFRLPIQQKYRHAEKRYLIRRYLEKMGCPAAIYQKQQKLGGIAPAVADLCLRRFKQNALGPTFHQLPLLKPIYPCTDRRLLTAKVNTYMLDYYQKLTRF